MEFYEKPDIEDCLVHFGVKGMKWGVRKKEPPKYSDKDVVIKKGQEIHRFVPKNWVDNEKKYSGHAYVSFDEDDVKRYREISKMFGSDNYVDMTFSAKKTIVSPSEKKRVEEFITLMDSDPKTREAVIKATRHPFLFVPKKKFSELDDPVKADEVYRKFSYVLVSKKDIRDAYFKQLEQKGYSMVLDDADIRGGISKSPAIIFDRTDSLKLKSTETIKEYEEKRGG